MSSTPDHDPTTTPEPQEPAAADEVHPEDPAPDTSEATDAEVTDTGDSAGAEGSDAGEAAAVEEDRADSDADTADHVDKPDVPAAEPDADEPRASTPESATQEPTTASQRLKGLLGKPGRSQIMVAVLLAVLGFAAVTQVRSTELDDSYEGRREEELIEIFNGLTGTSDRTRKEIARLEQARRELQGDTSARTAAIEQAEARLRTLNILAGLVPATGPGLRITVTEEDGRVSIDSLLDMVQELRTAGAEAMEFNDEVRVVASSSFSEVDGVIQLDGVELRSPYVIEVIGDPHTLNAGVTFPSGPIAKLEGDEKATVEIEELDSVDVESVRDLPRAEFAEPAGGQ